MKPEESRAADSVTLHLLHLLAFRGEKDSTHTNRVVHTMKNSLIGFQSMLPLLLFSFLEEKINRSCGETNNAGAVCTCQRTEEGRIEGYKDERVKEALLVMICINYDFWGFT